MTTTTAELENIKVISRSAFENVSSTADTDLYFVESDALLTLGTSGTQTLMDKCGYKVTPTAAITFSLPSISDLSSVHQIFIQVNLSTVYSIDLGLGNTPHYINNKAPDLSEVGQYNLYYEYDNINQYWVCGSLKKGTAS